MRNVGFYAVLLVVVQPVWAQTPLFRQAARYTLPGSATDTAYVDALVAADIGSPDGPPDGIADVISANVNQLAPVLFGTPEGTFTTGPNSNIGVVPTALALADLTGDGHPDLVVADSLNIRVLRGIGDGSFGAPGPEIPAGLGVTALAIVDLNADGKSDVVAVDDGDQLLRAGAVAILLGQGGGSFASPPNVVPTGTGSSGVALGDYNRDGKTDLAVSNAGDATVSVLLGDGRGGFTSGQTAAAGEEPTGIAAGEFTGDGRLDLVVVNRNTDMVSVLDGIGDGGFRAPRSFASGSDGSEPTTVAVADLNDDGRLDVVVSNKRSSDTSVLLGNGRGTLARPRMFVADQEPRAVLVGDFTADDLPDVLTVNQGTDTPNLAVLAGLGDGSLAAVEDVMTQPQPSAVVTGDADNNGLADLIASQLPSQTSGAGSLRIMLAQSGGGFGAPSTLASTGDAIAAVAADFNVDGVLDVGAVNRSTSSVSIFLGRASGGYAAVRNYTIGSGATAVLATDLNADGRPDLAVSRQTSGAGGVDVLLARADGTFDTARSTTVGNGPVGLDDGDFNEDGKRDLVVANSASNDLSVLRGNGDGTFQAASAVPSTGSPRAVIAADFDRDGFDDVAVARSISSAVTVSFGNGQGAFVAGPLLRVDGSVAAVGSRDVTGDGIPDVLIADQVANRVLAYVSQGSSRRFVDDEIGASRGPTSVAAGDTDGDGRYDVLAANSFIAGSVSVITNIGATAVTRGDANGDGRVSAADTLAVIRELADGAGRPVEDVVGAGGSYRAGPGIDANGDGIVTAQDVRVVAARLFPGS